MWYLPAASEAKGLCWQSKPLQAPNEKWSQLEKGFLYSTIWNIFDDNDDEKGYIDRTISYMYFTIMVIGTNHITCLTLQVILNIIMYIFNLFSCLIHNKVILQILKDYCLNFPNYKFIKFTRIKQSLIWWSIALLSTILNFNP